MPSKVYDQAKLAAGHAPCNQCHVAYSNGVLLIMLCHCRGPSGAASIVPYDLCIAADALGGGHLITSALQGLQDRQAAHRHPSATAHTHHSSSSSSVTGVSELEYRAWQDMPQEPALAELLGKGASKISR